jgi:hypothetical protein
MIQLKPKKANMLLALFVRGLGGVGCELQSKAFHSKVGYARWDQTSWLNPRTDFPRIRV